jgi:hypothetical protein
MLAGAGAIQVGVGDIQHMAGVIQVGDIQHMDTTIIIPTILADEVPLMLMM